MTKKGEGNPWDTLLESNGKEPGFYWVQYADVNGDKPLPLRNVVIQVDDYDLVLYAGQAFGPIKLWGPKISDPFCWPDDPAMERGPGFYWAKCKIRTFVSDGVYADVPRVGFVEVDDSGEVLFIDGAQGTVERWGPRIIEPVEHDTLNWEIDDEWPRQVKFFGLEEP